MFTQRAALLGFVGFCFYLIAIVNNLPAYYFALTWLSVGILVSSLGLALLSLIGLKCDWNVARARATENDSEGGPLVGVALSNVGTLNKTGILLEFRLQSARDAASLVRRALVEALPSGAAIDSSLPLTDLPRGRYKIHEVLLLGSDVLGLFRIRGRAHGVGVDSLVVGPATVALPGGAAWLRQAPGPLMGAIQAPQWMGGGDELRGTRPYQPGDDLKRVHWNSTARAGQLVVKEFHHSSRNWNVLVWDGAQTTSWGAPGDDATEWGLRLVASLGLVLTQSGQGCALARLDNEPIFAAPRGGGDAAAFVDVLADARADRQTSLAGAWAKVRPSSSTLSDVYLVSASLSPELAALVEKWRGQGARVRVGLVNGAALAHRNASRRASRANFQEIATESGPQRLAVTPAAFEEQARLLRLAGAQVALVEPLDDGDFQMPIGRAARQMLGMPKAP